MDVVRPTFLPDPALTREEMAQLQRELADAASFADDLGFDPEAVDVVEPFPLDDAAPPLGGSGSAADDGAAPPSGEPRDRSSGDPSSGDRSSEDDGDRTPADDGTATGQSGRTAEPRQRRLSDPARPEPVVVGVDQAFLDEQALSAVVAIRNGRVLERAYAVTDLEMPYVPGFLSFREGRPILAALDELRADPELLLLDGSGRIHFREAGIATHVGVLLDVPSIGVAKRLLCGTPARPLDDPLPAGTRVEVRADERMELPDGTVVGQAFQSRQFDSGTRHVNPLYVSPGHRVSVETATDLVERCCAGYKLPEPTRLADAAADAVKANLD